MTHFPSPPRKPMRQVEKPTREPTAEERAEEEMIAKLMGGIPDKPRRSWVHGSDFQSQRSTLGGPRKS